MERTVSVGLWGCKLSLSKTTEPGKVGVKLRTEHMSLEVEVEEDEGSKQGAKETRQPGRPSVISYLSHSCSQRSPLDTRTGRPHHRPHTGLRAGRGWRHRHPPLENTQRVGPSCREGLWGREERTAGRRDRGRQGAVARRGVWHTCG